MEAMKGTLVMDDEDLDRAQPMYSFSYTSKAGSGGQAIMIELYKKSLQNKNEWDNTK